MSGKLSKRLQAYYSAPEPERKAAFLQTLSIREKNGERFAGNFYAMLVQIRYIRKWVWGTSILILALMLLGMRASGLTPQLYSLPAGMLTAAIGLVEQGRSRICRMGELEMASRFSLRYITLTRMCAIGMFQLLLLVPTSYLAGKITGAGAPAEYLYLLVPYLLSAYVGMWYGRHIRSDRYGIGIFVFAALISVTVAGSSRLPALLYAGVNTVPWVLAAALLLALTFAECRKTLIRTTELVM